MAKKPASDKPEARQSSMVTRKPSGPRGGAPEIVIDMDALKSLVEIQCTAEECASVVGVSVDTIDRRLKESGYAGFADFYKKHGDEGKTSLRRAQWKAATVDHNPTMLDKSEVELTGNFAALLAERRKKRSDAG